MIRTAGIRDDDLVTLQLVGDLSYAWELVDSFTMDMQDGIKRDPALVGKLRATFLKVSLGLLLIWLPDKQEILTMVYRKYLDFFFSILCRGKSLLELSVTTYHFASRLTATLNLCSIYLKLFVHVLYWYG